MLSLHLIFQCNETVISDHTQRVVSSSLYIHPPSTQEREKHGFKISVKERKVRWARILTTMLFQNNINCIEWMHMQFKLERGSRHSQATSQLTKQWPNVIS